jgi:hypothetical protein
MPKFAILVSRDDYGFYKYILIIDHVSHANGNKYDSPTAAFKAALEEANRRGEYNVS